MTDAAETFDRRFSIAELVAIATGNGWTVTEKQIREDIANGAPFHRGRTVLRDYLQWLNENPKRRSLDD